MRTVYSRAAAATLTLLLLAPAAPARAQEDPPATTKSGTLVLERVPSGFVAAPDMKIADFDGDVGTLIGGYAGWLSDRRLLLGAAGYWLANGRRDQEFAYGGLVVGWTFNGGGRIGFGLRSLVGGGQATLSDDLTITRRTIQQAGRNQRGAVTIGTTTSAYRYWYDQEFFIFEPQASVVFRVAGGVALDLGAGYRVIGAADGFEDRLRGATGSLAIRFGGR